jgi:immediate early response 3-interacting protein 1
VAILLGNSVIILNRQRFLAKYGMDNVASSNVGESGMKGSIAGLVHASSYLKVPMIFGNLLVIVVELLLGG